MAEPEQETSSGKAATRRSFVKTSAQVAATAPAVALLLRASTKPAAACAVYGAPQCRHILDDFTFGNTREDIDAIRLGSNFNPDDGKPQQDDHVV